MLLKIKTEVPAGILSVREHLVHHLSRLRLRTVALTALVLIFCSSLWLYGNTGMHTIAVRLQNAGFAGGRDSAAAAGGHSTWSDTTNSTRSDWARQRRGHLIPPKIWQIMLPKAGQPEDAVVDTDKISETVSWSAMNLDYMHTLVGARGGHDFVLRHFGNGSDIYNTYNALTNVGMKSDFLRYLLLDVEGGVYSDTDTVALKPVDAWIPAPLRNRTRLVVGIEFDKRDGPAWADIAHPVQFCQWTIAAAPRHPVFRKMAARVVESVRDIEERHGGAPLGEIRDLQSFDVMNSTGPAAWTEVVFAHLQSVEPARVVNYESLSYMTEPTLYGDVLVLPIDGFGMGQQHSGSTNDGSVPEAALVKHLFGGSWRDLGRRRRRR